MATIAQPFSDSQLQATMVAVRVSATLSILGTVAIMINMYRDPKQRTVVNRLVLYMAIQDLIGSVFQWLANYPAQWSIENHSTGFCTAQAFIVQWMVLGAFCWCGSIALNVLILFVKRCNVNDLRKLEKWYLVINYGLTFLLAFILLFVSDGEPNNVAMGMYGDATLWCWIKGTPAGQWTRFYLFYMILWSLFIFNTVTYVYVGRIIWKSAKSLNSFSTTQLSSNSSSAWEQYTGRTIMYLLVFLVTWTPATINRTQNLISPGKPVFAIFLLHSIFTPLQGFLSALAYFFLAKWTNQNQNQSRNKDQERGTQQSQTIYHLGRADSGLDTSEKDLVTVPLTFRISEQEDDRDIQERDSRYSYPVSMSFQEFLAEEKYQRL